VVGRLVGKCVMESRRLMDLTAEELRAASALFSADALNLLPPEACVAARQSRGGTARDAVEVQLRQAKALLAQKS